MKNIALLSKDKENVDLSSLILMPQLEEVSLIGDFSGIEEFFKKESSIRILRINFDKESFDLNLLSLLPNLEILDINGKVTNFDYFSKNPKIRVIIQYPSKKFLECIQGVDKIDCTQLLLDANKCLDLKILNKFPNLSLLSLSGKFENYEEIPKLKNLKALKLFISENDTSILEKLMTDKLEYLIIQGDGGMSREKIWMIEDLSFIEKACNLKILELRGLPRIESLPDLNNIYALKIYELHRLNQLESLTKSKIKYLSLMLCADKITGTNIAKTISEMKHLEIVDFCMDRGPKRDIVVENQLKKMNLEHLYEQAFPDLNIYNIYR